MYPIIAVTGPRQSGKTTLLKTVFNDYRYISLENPDLREYATLDPKGFLEEYDDKVIFDEVQRVTILFSYLQTRVDDSGKMGQYILSGSQNFLLMENITQSLAGRVALFKLLPFDFGELKTAGLLSPDYMEMMQKGFYPAIYDRNIPSDIFYSNYIQTYVEKDISEILKIHDIRLFRNFVRMCAARAGQLLNLSSLANSCGISQPTAKSWISILESSYIIFQLQPYFQNFNKRITKTPKLYFYDTGLVSHLLGIRRREDLIAHPMLGNLFENLIIAEKFKHNYHNNQMREYWFWRDSNGHEIDLLQANPDSVDIFEIKSTKTVLPKLFAGLDYFDGISGGKVASKTLFYGGNKSQKRTNYQVNAWDNIY